MAQIGSSDVTDHGLSHPRRRTLIIHTEFFGLARMAMMKLSAGFGKLISSRTKLSGIFHEQIHQADFSG
jgi:hypothetical protein